MENLLYFFVLIIVSYFVCKYVGSKLSSIENINDTETGKKVYNKTFESVVPLALSRDNDGYNLMLWNNKSTAWNPNQWDFYIKLPIGTKFKVVNINKKYGIDSGNSLQIQVKLVDDIDIDTIEYLETDMNKITMIPLNFDVESNYYFKNINILESDSPRLNEILNGNVINKKLKLNLYSSGFLYSDGVNIIDINNSVIKQI